MILRPFKPNQSSGIIQAGTFIGLLCCGEQFVISLIISIIAEATWYMLRKGGAF